MTVEVFIRSKNDAVK